jgi:putative CocE/NonD family hydrolase
MGAGVWRRTETWPPSGVQSETLYLRADGALSADPPTAADESVEYAVDFSAGTGAATRWTTSMGGGPVDYGNRAAADEKLLTFTTPPLRETLTITGAPRVDIQLSSSIADIAVLAYLEAVAPDDRVYYLTEGALRALHRRTHPGRSPHDPFGPNRSFLRKDAWPLTPHARASLEFNLIPTSVEIPRGWRVRLALAGHDKDSFARVPSKGAPIWRLFTQAGAVSRLIVPVHRAPGRGDELPALLW